ncbi:MAG TPA: HtaA domain-containing protein, partial [Rhodoglobus sp.]|nr:HtaA domain-containing protein [Rhodoglobus sp.]
MFASNRSRGRSAAAVTAAIALVVSGLLSASPATADELDAVEIVAPVENEPVEPVPTEQPEPAEGPVVDGVPDEPAPAEEPARAEQHTEPTADAAVAPLAIDEPAAQPQTPTILVSQTTGLSPAGQTVTVTGTGFGPVAPLTNGTRPPLTGRFGGAYVVFGRFADVWQPSVGAPTSARTIADQRWVVNPEDAASLGSAAVAIRPDGSFTVELTVATGFPNEPATGNYGIYTYGGSGAGYAPFETYTPVSFSTAPMITLSESTGLDPAGDTVTVRGWNFTAAAPATNGTRPPLAGRFGGAYVVLGKFPQVWQPSAGVPSSSRTTGTQRWGVNAADAPLLGAAGFVIAPDGSFTIELPVSAIAPAASGNYGVYTYAGSGAVHAPFETYTPISFAAAPVTPTTTELTAAPATGLFEGASPTLTAAVSPAAAGSVVFRSGDAVLATVPVAGGRASVTTASLAAGAHTFVATFSPADPVLHASSSGELTLVVTPRPSAPAAESPQQQGSGSLTWGVKQSFRSYVVGPIARGSVSTSGVGSSGGALVFGQAVGGDFDAATGTGTARYSGSVRFQGHGGTLDLTLADPVVRLDSAGAGMLLLTAGGAGLVPFATLDLAAGIRSTPDGTVAYTGVPATLTA